MCTIPLLRRVCRESYNDPEAVYDRLKRLGMDLVTITDHDSIDAVEPLRRRPDFFLSEEITCRMPSGTELHMGVYDITERDHAELQRRRDDYESLLAYLRERGLFFSANHVFSSLTGRRAAEDFDLFAADFPAFETLNAHMLIRANRGAAQLAQSLRKAAVGGSDAHTLASVGSAWTEVRGARSAQEYLEGLRRGAGVVRGETGSVWKLTRDVLTIGATMVQENVATLPLAPLALLVPAVTIGNYIREWLFARAWISRLEIREAAREVEA